MKIFIACSKYSYKYVANIKLQLEFLGHEVILPNFFDTPMIEEEIKSTQTKEEHIDFCRNSFLESQEKAKNSDAILVANFDKEKHGVVYENYIGAATFLEMYDSYNLRHPIYLYNDIPNNMLYDEIEGMNPTILNGNLFKIDKNYKKYENNNLLKYFSKEELENIESFLMVIKASCIVSEVFKNIKDKEGKPYINHLFRVSQKLDTQIEKTAAILHDIVEDTEITYKDLLEIGFPIEVVQIVSLVTNKKIDKTNLSEEEKLKIYSDKIDSIIASGNMSAIRLKEADMSDNYNPERLNQLPPEQQEWFDKKYGKQLVKLRNVKKDG